jgi:uncharacterized protein (UPF0335 family)
MSMKLQEDVKTVMRQLQELTDRVEKLEAEKAQKKEVPAGFFKKNKSDERLAI